MLNKTDIIKKQIKVRAYDNLPMVGKKKISRNYIINLFKQFEFKKGAEIGVFKGGFSRIMLEQIPGLELLCVDKWVNHGHTKGSSSYKTAMDNLKNLNAIIKNMPSIEAAALVEDYSLDFVYIDAEHQFDGIMMDLILWSKKVKPGGIISGHDYKVNYQYGVIEAVNAYTRAHNVTEFFVTNKRGDAAPSFFWVNENNHNQNYSK